MENEGGRTAWRGGRQRGRVLRGLLVIALVGGAVAAAFAWLNQHAQLDRACPEVEGRITASGLRAPVWIVRDRRGVPHIRAKSEHDAWFALGFVQAQDRLGQMLWLRRQASGRTAEVIGAEGLPADRWARTLGLALLARAEVRHLPTPVRQALEAYSAGVNVEIQRIARGVQGPPLGIGESPKAIAPWSPDDSIALLKLHAWGLEGSLEELVVLARLIQHLGPISARPFFPDTVGLAVMPPGDRTARGPRPPAGSGGPAPLRAAMAMAGSSVGSAAWVVEGSLTRHGRPLLAADSHFGPQLPAHLYEAHIRGGSLEVAGATLPGIPAFWTGFTPDVAWASTHYPALVADLFAETLDPDDPGAYRDGNRWRKLRVRHEEIRVRGGATEHLEVRATRRGPLVDRLLPLAERTLSMKWTGAMRGPDLEGLLELAHAHDAADVRAALRHHWEPAVAVIYADAKGAGGLQVAGAIPKREVPSGAVPVPGSDPAYDWSDTLPFDALPALDLGGRRPYLVAADGPLPGSSGIERLWEPGSRSRRIEALLRQATARGPLDLTGLVEMQRDVRSPDAVDVIAAALAMVGDPSHLPREAAEIMHELLAWKGRSGAESRGAAAYHVFVERLVRNLFEPALGKELLDAYLDLPRVAPEELVLKTLGEARKGGDPEYPWTDPAFVEKSVRQSLRDAWIVLSVELGPNREKWTWGRLHTLRFRRLLRLPLAARRILPGALPYGGDGGTVQVAEYRGIRSFGVQVASTYRLATDAGNLDQALTSLLPGESEHPASDHAFDQLERWRQGRPSLLSTSDPVIEDGPVARLQLVPAP